MKNLCIPKAGHISILDFDGDIQKAIKVAEVLRKAVYIPDGMYEIKEPIVVSGVTRIYGDGMHSSTLRACADFASIFRFASTSAYVTVEDMAITTDGYATKCAHLDANSVVVRFKDCYFGGDLAGDLIHSSGQNLDLTGCSFQLSSADTVALNLDCYNQNTGVTDCRFGGPGKGIRITNDLTPGSNRVEGLKVTGAYFINTGAYNVEIGTSLFTSISGSCLDQASVHAVRILKGADNVVINGGYIGSSQPNSSVNVYIHPEAGRGHSINGAILAYSAYGVYADATTSHRVSGLTLNGNTFNTVKNPFMLDSVEGCIVTSNNDTGSPVNGTFNTNGTYGPGSYLIDNNRFHTAAPALLHAGSTYKWGNTLGWHP